MENTWTKILQWLSLAAVGVGLFFTNMPVIYQTLLVFMVLDIIAGFARAFAQKQLSPNLAYNGIFKKGIELLLVGAAIFLQKMTGATGIPLPEALASFYIYVEGLSILANASAAGVPIPDFLKDALASLSPDKKAPTTPLPEPAPPKVE